MFETFVGWPPERDEAGEWETEGRTVQLDATPLPFPPEAVS